MKQSWTNGAVLKIDLQEGIAYCQMIRHPFYAFFPSFGENINSSDSMNRGVLFRIAVSNRAFKTGRWRIIGVEDVRADISSPIRFFKKDIISKSISIVEESGFESAALPYQCNSLEPAAVWEPEHVEERLLDYLNGRENRWMTSMKI